MYGERKRCVGGGGASSKNNLHNSPKIILLYLYGICRMKLNSHTGRVPKKREDKPDLLNGGRKPSTIGEF